MAFGVAFNILKIVCDRELRNFNRVLQMRSARKEAIILEITFSSI